jgi:hypothetical protein
MPDTAVADHGGSPYDPVMEIRVSRLEGDMRDVNSSIGRLEMTSLRIETMLAATLPHLATKADLAEKPSKTYMWGRAERRCGGSRQLFHAARRARR